MYYDNPNDNPLYLPVRSVFYRDGKSLVWIYNPADSTVSGKEVGTDGLLGEGNIRIISGLKGDEIVVVAGVHEITDNQKVEALDEISETNIGGLL
jgi:hypothetical protein